jgi:hypothetical protein
MQPEMDPVARDRARRRQKRQEQVQRRRLALGVGVLALVVIVVALAVGLSGGDDTTTGSSGGTSSTSIPLESSSYSASLTGDQSVPSVKTQAAATFKMEYISETKELSWSLEITHTLTSPASAAIYEGAPGSSGAAVYTLYVAPEGKEGAPLGILAEGVINEEDLVGPLQGGTLAQLVQIIRDGNAYVSIGNKSHPTDAIRGQIQSADGASTTTTATTES